MDHEAMREAMDRARRYSALRHEVWELLRSHQALEPLRDQIDPMLFDEMGRIAEDLRRQFTMTELVCLTDLDSLPVSEGEDRVWPAVDASAHPEILRKIRAGEVYAHMIWDIIEPPVVS